MLTLGAPVLGMPELDKKALEAGVAVPGLKSATLEFYRRIRRNVPGWTLKQGVPSNEKLKKIFGPHAR
jgi:hypothetical protein